MYLSFFCFQCKRVWVRKARASFCSLESEEAVLLLPLPLLLMLLLMLHIFLLLKSDSKVNEAEKMNKWLQFPQKWSVSKISKPPKLPSDRLVKCGTVLGLQAEPNHHPPWTSSLNPQQIVCTTQEKRQQGKRIHPALPQNEGRPIHLFFDYTCTRGHGKLRLPW